MDNNIKIFDSHAHYDSDCFVNNIDEILDEQKNNGVRYIMNIGSSLESSRICCELADKFDFVYAAVGVHPDDADKVDDNCIDELKNLAKNKKVKAIGEIGLDYHYEDVPREIQKIAFQKQLILEKELDLPVVIHSRDAFEDTFALLKKYNPRGVMHCFSGSKESAREILKLEMYIGFTGVLTFKNAKKAVEAAREIPIDRLLLETDCPYMAPEPFRGKSSVSSMIRYTAQKLAEIKEMDLEEVLDKTLNNAKNLFDID